ncbi:chemosensory receptor a [Plakobranchus ocellatus]|uniref:Chemosensory receptor a n=1 Tax=Plakobranchus ocellatus TaxID=259542 RepID=A0AAV3YM50_9GAST|nr:chemosensory receptor a [Plakobranchus ocellatus]
MARSDQMTTVTPLAQGVITQGQYNVLIDFLTSVQTFTSIFGLITNSININTFLAMRAFKDGVTLTFLLLSMSHLCLSFAAAALCSCAFLISQESKWLLHLTTDVSYENYAKTIGYFFSVDPAYIGIISFHMFQVSNVTAIFLTVYLAVARCLCVLYPLKFRNIITVRKTLLLSALFFIISLGIRIPILTHDGVSLDFDPRINATRYRFVVHPNRKVIKDNVWVSMEAPICVVAQITLIVSVGIMAKVLRASAEFRSEASVAKSDLKKSREKIITKDVRVVKQLVLVSSIFIACNTPKFLAYFASFFEPNFYLGRRQSAADQGSRHQYSIENKLKPKPGRKGDFYKYSRGNAHISTYVRARAVCLFHSGAGGTVNANPP